METESNVVTVMIVLLIPIALYAVVLAGKCGMEWGWKKFYSKRPSAANPSFKENECEEHDQDNPTGN